MSQSFLQRSSFDSWPIAKPLHRTLALLIDSVLVLVVVAILMKLFRQPMHMQNTPYFWLICMWFWEAFFVIFTGSSPGKRLLSLEIYSPRYDGAPSPVQISLRIIMFWMGLGLLGIGVLPILSRRDHRGWHDLIAETLVIGTSRSSPSTIATRWVPDIILILSLLLFSGIGARIFSVGLKNSQISTYSLKNCDSPEAFVKNTKNVLVGLVISPAFTNCWQAIETTNQNIKDAKIYQLAAIAKKYHQYLLIDKDERTEFFKNEIKPLEASLCATPSKECNSAGFLATLETGEDISYSENYFSESEAVLKQIAKSDDIAASLPKIIEGESNGWMKTLLTELEIGVKPEKLKRLPLVSNNRDWIHAVECLDRISSHLTTSSCDKMQTAYYAATEAKIANFDPIDDYLSTQARDFIYEELKALKTYYTAVANKDEAIQKDFLATYPRDSIFRSLVP
ncbi:MAG: RDD family protein [Bdellovibrionales bacterium]|nr:RDD family protein [Bdellovibrionales bacterium]